MLICMVAGHTWQHIWWVLKAYRGWKKDQTNSYERNPSSTITERLEVGKLLLENPTVALLSPGCPPVPWPLLSLHLLVGVIPTSRSSPAWFLNPEVKARDQRSCWRVPEWLKKAQLAQRPRQQRKQNKRQNIRTANLYNVIVTKAIVPHPASY